MCILQNAHLLREIGFEVFFLLYDFYGVMDSEKEDCKSFWGDHFFYFTPSGVYKSIHKIASKLVPSLNRKVDFYCSDSLVSFINKLHIRENFEGLLVNYIWLSKLYKTNIPKKALYTHDVFTNRADRITANGCILLLIRRQRHSIVLRMYWLYNRTKLYSSNFWCRVARCTPFIAP